MRDQVRIQWMWLPDERVIAVRVSDEMGIAELVLKSRRLGEGEPIRSACESLFAALEAIGYSHGQSRAEVLAGSKVGFEVLGLAWDAPAAGEAVLQ
jgi:hypothetical protein